ncbi:tRNA (adenosine(37)-N6)-threonylcarbamoyltransferase complex ATPase subunit type 1 TsaE [Ruegeria sp. 2012CJ41-6]|uniref:tRNA threonylcarbamoyladenosine biosynthesis protein TsaE n=1 Tax=Ruegeria spongiae TaxID=2942209 RepID=A0ABT0Q154_9RHOB|nr:tRNA (adenosine(37)-N6)-threonylcarbamoyltransferase complex ATPase subunit type 1 TsaE [Ruegeria spongiae]MCL6283518.1 tRNA (adenosine(37)-N6)-threonylcarbamoyltransferase complex ATPase subunit type 1 TsaE [Ruegeria spongiae]
MNSSRSSTLRKHTRSPAETAALAQAIGPTLEPGDCLLLVGPIGSGKTHFARHLIQNLMTEIEDVPSPTYTLVQSYETRRGELWHADLYRLTGTGEIEELGLTDAFETAICLIEWPDRLAELTPEAALHITFDTDTDPDQTEARNLSFAWTDPKWQTRLDSLA